MISIRILACALLLLAGYGSAAAQSLPKSGAGRGAPASEEARRGVGAPAGKQRFGAKAGANVANVHTDGEDGAAAFDARTGLVAGVFATWRALSWLEVQPELLYTSKGAKVDEAGIDSRLVLDYLELPLLARVSRRVSRSTVYAAAGPALAWRLRAKSRTLFSGSTEELDLADDIEPFDLGLAIGGGIEIGALVFDGRYTLGLRDIDADTSDAVGMKNRVVSVTAGFRF